MGKMINKLKMKPVRRDYFETGIIDWYPEGSSKSYEWIKNNQLKFKGGTGRFRK